MVIFVIPGLKGGKTDKEKSAEQRNLGGIIRFQRAAVIMNSLFRPSILCRRPMRQGRSPAAGAETYFSVSAWERYQILNTKRLGIALEEEAWTVERPAELSDGRLVLDQIVPGETIQAPVYVIL